MILSIIVPIYNTEKYLRKCIDSILAQTLTDFECILVDDGSTDNCPAICDEYAEKDPRIVVIHKPNGGLSDARNAGLDIAQGDYIGFVDSDDFIDSQMYETMYNIAINSVADIVESRCRLVNSLGIPIEETTARPKNISIQKYTKNYLLENFNSHGLNGIVCSNIYRKDIFEHIRFPVGKIYEDTYIVPEILDAINIVVKISNLYYNYRQLESSIMHAPFSFKSADVIDVYYRLFCFFKNKQIHNQACYALERYINTYSKIYFTIYLKHKEYKKNFKVYKKQALSHMLEITKNPLICRFKKFTFISMHFFPNLSHKICMKYFPEMLELKYDERCKLKNK